MDRYSKKTKFRLKWISWNFYRATEKFSCVLCIKSPISASDYISLDIDEMHLCDAYVYVCWAWGTVGLYIEIRMIYIHISFISFDGPTHTRFLAYTMPCHSTTKIHEWVESEVINIYIYIYIYVVLNRYRRAPPVERQMFQAQYS